MYVLAVLLSLLLSAAFPSPVSAQFVFPPVASGSVSDGGTNGAAYRDSAGLLHGTAAGGAGTLCLLSTDGGVPVFGSCAGSASTLWSALTAPTGNLSLAMAARTTTFTWGAATGASTNPFTVTDTTNNSGTGALFAISTASGSALFPFQATAVGTSNGVRMSVLGSLNPLGTGHVNADQINATSLSGLATGILKNTTTTGIPSIAIAADFPTLNQSTTANAGTATALATARSIYGNNFDGTAALTQIIASTFGGTGNGFFKIAGPATSEKTHTWPNQSIDWTALSGVMKMASGVPSVVAGTSTNCVLVDGTSATCGSGGGAPVGAQYLALATDATLTNERVWTLNADGSLTCIDSGAGAAFTCGVANNIVGFKAVANSWTAKQTFPITSTVAGINIPEGSAPAGSLVAGDRYQNSTSHEDCHYNGSGFDCDAFDTTTTRGDTIVRGASGLTRLAVGGAGTFKYSDGTDITNRIPLCGDVSGAACLIANGAKALATSAIASGTCTSAQTDTATGTVTTDVIIATLNSDPTGVTGYAPSTNGGLFFYVYPTTDTVNIKVCNNTASSITPGARTLNWRVFR